MEDTSLLSPVSLLVIVIGLFVINLVMIVQDLCCTFLHVLHFSSNVALILWRHDTKHWPSVVSETDASCATTTTVVRCRVSFEEVKAMIDESEALYVDGLVDDGEGLLEKSEVSGEEVREAFRLFDENEDGFIDEQELKRVLCLLGFDGWTENDCRTMIRAFDDDGDGKIDLQEFVRLIEKSFSIKF